MALVKTNPLPVGRYQKILLPDTMAGVPKDGQHDGPSVFANWLSGIAEGYVDVEHSEYLKDGEVFVIFRTLKPGVPWSIAHLIGWPETAPASVKDFDTAAQGAKPTAISQAITQGDTAKAVVETAKAGAEDAAAAVTDAANAAVNATPWWVKAGLGVLAVVGIGYAIRSVR